MTKIATLLCAATLTFTASAQNWTVGVPVDMLLYSQPFYGGCSPDADYTFSLPASAVAGVDYKVIITSITPAGGSLSIEPGLANGGLNDELIFDAEVQRSLTFASGTTSAVLEFRAQGTPTHAGDLHPCTASPFWMSNMMFCPEGLIPNMEYACTVQDATSAISEAGASDPVFQYPSPRNGQQLVVTLPAHESARLHVLDGLGRIVRSARISANGTVDLSSLPNGIYVMDLLTSTGHATTERFLLEQR